MKKQLWMSLVLLVVIAVIAVIIAVYGPAVQPMQAPAPPAPAETFNDSPLLFLGNQNIAPVVFLDGATPTGVAVDIVRALANHMPQPVEIKAMDWSEAQALVARGDADALIQINPTDERKKIYDFSDTLLESQFSIFTRSDKTGISGPLSLRGLRVGVESGGLPQQVLEKDPQILLTTIPNFPEGFRQLSEGSLDAVVVDYRVGSYVLAKNNIQNIKVTGDPVAFSYSSFAVKKGNTKLLNEINTALQIIKADGTYQKIIDKWKPTEVVFETQEQITERNYLYIILFFLVLFLIAGIWMVTIKKDLTRRKAAEEKLKEQYSTLRGIIDSTDALIFSVDRQYRYTSFNQGHAATMKAIYGAEIETGHSILEYMTVAEDRETARHNLDRALAGEHLIEDAYSGEELRSRHYFQVSHGPIRIQEEIIGVAVLARDITERKRAEDELLRKNEELLKSYEQITATEEELRENFEELKKQEDVIRESEEKYRSLVKYNPYGVLLTRTSGDILSANAAACRLLDRTEDEIKKIGRSGIVDTSDPRVAAAVAEREKAGIAIAKEMTFIRKDGSRFDGEVSSAIFLDRNGQPMTSMIFTDITERKRAEDALRKSGREWQTTFNAIADAVFLLDNEGRIIRHNRAFETTTGKPADEIDGRHCFEVMHGTASPVEGCPNVKAQKSRQRESLELKIGNRWFVAAADPVFSDTGEISGCVHLLIDITERKLAEEALFSSRQMLQLVLDSIPQRVFWKDRNSVFLGCNKTLALDAGFLEPADMVGKTDYDHASHATADLYRADDRQVMESGQPKINYEEPQIRKDGSHAWLRTTKVPLRNKEGTIIGVLGTYEDITERKMAQEAMQESEERFRNIFTNAAEGILIADISTQEFLYANPAICNMLGYSAQELTSMGMRDIHPEKDLAHVQEEFMAQAWEKKTLAESIPVLRKDGAVLYMDIRTTPVIIDGHRCNIGMFTDITERRRTENALQLARSKINLMNTVTFQDIQNAAFSLSAYHELLRTLVTDEKVKTFLEKQRALNQKIVNSLDFAKNYQDMGVKPPRWQNIGRVFLLAISHLDFLHIVRNLYVEDLEVYADPLLEKVFFRLMQNVLRYGEHATEVTLRYEEKPDGLVLFVEDNGVGIPAEEKHLIFDRGYGKNTGLGLFFVREVLSITDMTITETGEPGKGARFEILVPKEYYRFTTGQTSS
ncbi:MAG: PAS domain S-box protein [Methanoregula sp.]|jgi:PAS domain S-box-containing protein